MAGDSIGLHDTRNSIEGLRESFGRSVEARLCEYECPDAWMLGGPTWCANFWGVTVTGLGIGARPFGDMRLTQLRIQVGAPIRGQGMLGRFVSVRRAQEEQSKET